MVKCGLVFEEKPVTRQVHSCCWNYVTGPIGMIINSYFLKQFLKIEFLMCWCVVRWLELCTILVQIHSIWTWIPSAEILEDFISQECGHVDFIFQESYTLLISYLGQTLFLFCASLNSLVTFHHQFIESKSWGEYRSHNPDSQKMQPWLYHNFDNFCFTQ